jgi:hypothetical protein
MSLFTQPKVIYKGEDKSYLLTVVDENGDRVDITAFSIEFEVKPAAGDADPATIAKSVGLGITILAQSGGTLGQAQIDINPSDTNGIAALLYKYDVVVIDTTAERHVVIPPSTFEVREVVNIAP